MPDLYAILYLQGHLSVAGVRSTLKGIVFFLEVAGVGVGWKKALSRNLETRLLRETREIKQGSVGMDVQEPGSRAGWIIWCWRL